MMQFLAKAGLAVMLTAGTLAGTVAPAAAQLNIIIGEPDRGPPQDYRRPPPGYDRPSPGYDRPLPGYGRPSRGCNPQLAENLARDYGFRRARVVDITPRRVIVQGWTRRGPDEMSFGNVRGCPALRR
ncbi:MULTISPECIES: hypothetical protein [Rhizobium]|jgi:hypothetical protein|uniref:Antifreeze protein n=1 Tax=Rhizobium leguminosarum TaxID=384 RepID=A0A7M3DXT3_RHILE|nr:MULTISPECIES: hypothetical protein [Rhizobium]MBA9030408.1 hypothetical protein [Rhizobium leguminosarum]MBY5899181.1 hypothetical protein [Rhizobium leguminosarum]MBY5908744.1 hypothetical protein [Rhizobium leguminosarum]MBY5917785.1 hypothetical protein [Rhizobium leguminosarum]MCJ9696739.1 hypothetical protein [Rhizobium sp. PRIMUS64]